MKRTKSLVHSIKASSHSVLPKRTMIIKLWMEVRWMLRTFKAQTTTWSYSVRAMGGQSHLPALPNQSRVAGNPWNQERAFSTQWVVLIRCQNVITITNSCTDSNSETLKKWTQSKRIKITCRWSSIGPRAVSVPVSIRISPIGGGNRFLGPIWPCLGKKRSLVLAKSWRWKRKRVSAHQYIKFKKSGSAFPARTTIRKRISPSKSCIFMLKKTFPRQINMNRAARACLSLWNSKLRLISRWTRTTSCESQEKSRRLPKPDQVTIKLNSLSNGAPLWEAALRISLLKPRIKTISIRTLRIRK